MSRIQEAFQDKKAFIPFITCGDPDLETTEKLVYAMEEAGASLIELGIPFSDPTAEGPVIQEANIRALLGGVTTDKIFDMATRIRQRTQIPLVFMTYANVVFSYGTDCFLAAAAEIGMDGLILPDVPSEEKGEFVPACRAHGLDLISLAAPPRRTASPASPGRRRASSTWSPPLGSPGCGGRSPPTLGGWSLWPVRPTPPSPAPWALASPLRSRRPPWPRPPTGPSWAPPSSA